MRRSPSRSARFSRRARRRRRMPARSAAPRPRPRRHARLRPRRLSCRSPARRLAALPTLQAAGELPRGLLFSSASSPSSSELRSGSSSVPKVIPGLPFRQRRHLLPPFLRPAETQRRCRRGRRPATTRLLPRPTAPRLRLPSGRRHPSRLRSPSSFRPGARPRRRGRRRRGRRRPFRRRLLRPPRRSRRLPCPDRARRPRCGLRPQRRRRRLPPRSGLRLPRVGPLPPGTRSRRFRAALIRPRCG